MEDAVGAAGLADAELVDLQGVGADGAADRRGGDDEREPAEDRLAAVLSAPSACPGGEVRGGLRGHGGDPATPPPARASGESPSCMPRGLGVPPIPWVEGEGPARLRPRRRSPASPRYDLLQKRHAILRNFPVVGHFRFLLESIGPELRQYIVTSNDEERPFSRDQRRWVYASSKKENNTSASAPTTTSSGRRACSSSGRPRSPRRRRARRRPARAGVPAAVREGARRRRTGAAHAFRPQSVVNISGDELRLAVAAGGRGAQPRRRAGAVPAEHRRGRPRRPTCTAAI